MTSVLLTSWDIQVLLASPFLTLWLSCVFFKNRGIRNKRRLNKFSIYLLEFHPIYIGRGFQVDKYVVFKRWLAIIPHLTTFLLLIILRKFHRGNPLPVGIPPKGGGDFRKGIRPQNACNNSGV